MFHYLFATPGSAFYFCTMAILMAVIVPLALQSLWSKRDSDPQVEVARQSLRQWRATVSSQAAMMMCLINCVYTLVSSFSVSQLFSLSSLAITAGFQVLGGFVFLATALASVLMTQTAPAKVDRPSADFAG